MEYLVYKSVVFYLIALLKPVTIYKLIYICGAINPPLCTQLLILLSLLQCSSRQLQPSLSADAFVLLAGSFPWMRRSLTQCRIAVLIVELQQDGNIFINIMYSV